MAFLPFSTAKSAGIIDMVRKLLHIFHIVFHSFFSRIVENRGRIIACCLQKLMKHVKEVAI